MTRAKISSLSAAVAASRRWRQLHADDAPGVARDRRVAIFFKERAVQQGASFDPLWRR